METKMTEQIYQQVANTLVNIIPEEWKKIFLYAEYREGYKRCFFTITHILGQNLYIALT